MNWRDFIHKIFSFLEARPVVGGLDISDSALRFMASASSFAASVRLAPGIVVDGRVENQAALADALKTLRAEILGRRSRMQGRINVVVSLSSAHIYSQIFTLPALEGGNLDKAVELNLQMALPGGAPSNAGWEKLSVGGNTGKIEVLAGFLEKSIADDLTAALAQSGFSIIAIEFRGASLARVAKFSQSPEELSTAAIVSADESGLDVLVVRNGHLQFDYYNSWKNLQGQEKEITLDTFRSELLRSVNQVFNFYGSHWKEPLTRILVAATALQAEITTALSANFGNLKIQDLASPVSPPVTPEWFAALGGALRARLPRKNDTELSLLGVDAREKFWEEQMEHFLSFWKLLVPFALTVLLLAYGAAWLFLNYVNAAISSSTELHLSPDQTSQIEELQAKALSFNQAADMIKQISDSTSPKSPIISEILDIAGRQSITVDHLTVASPATPVSLSGSAATQDDIVNFKNELSVTPGIQNVNLPVTNIRKDGDNYDFSITFLASS